MRTFKHSLISLTITILGALAFGTLLLFLEPKEGIIAWLVLSLLFIGILISVIIGYLQKRRADRVRPLSLITTSITLLAIWILTLVLIFANFTIYKVDDFLTAENELSAVQKLAYYQQFLTGPESMANLEELETTHRADMAFYYPHGKEYIDEINKIADFIPSNKKQFEKSLGGRSDAAVSVVLYPDESSMPKREANSTEYSGLYTVDDQMIHLPIPVDFTALAHEYIHHLFFSIGKDRGMLLTQIPQWWSEGIATHLSQKNGSTPLLRLNEENYIEFKQLTDVGEWENHLKKDSLPYKQSSTFINYLMINEGEDVIAKIFSEMENANFPTSFQRVTGKTIEEYEGSFVSDFKSIAELWDEASLLETRDNEAQKSLESFLAIAEIMPNLELVNHRIANLYMEIGDYEKAIEYRKNELEIAVADKNDTLSSSYGYLAESQLFINLREAINTAELAVQVSSEYDLEWNKGRLEELTSLDQQIKQGRPLQGYFELLNGKFVINGGSSNPSEKIGLIKIALNEYSGKDLAGEEKLSSLKKTLEKELALEE
ncbi:type IV pilus biogenesis/stability protein PilW [Planomicrobium sp. YIM 101495]|uniref:tetratricopeptide repeat protein n=1 Tax=Planomicrobium sp. YIM 101495 TaxID=2665160 RepID=UPI0012B70650|nr:tetratricopeptide repeat protein [Planomicrobium sp. YIM 101495]MTD29855.1 hypothetical protein [Planomicrobium sp. YIM 101495]